MLKFLHIENIAVIESCDIEFTEGLNVLTGETGAGKSIVIDSINAVLGERTSKELIRSGCDTANVTALFGELGEDTVKKLSEMDISPDEDGNIVITRRMSLNGKGIIKINGIPVTAALLRDMAVNLINIHGQHDNQGLLDPQRHSDYIDAVAGNAELREKYYRQFKKLNDVRRELKELNADAEEKQRRSELLKYQIEELTAAQIKPGEIKELKQRLEIAENYEKNIRGFAGAEQLFYGDDSSDGIITRLKLAQKLLSALKNPDAEKCCASIVEIISLAEDTGEEVSEVLENLEAEPEDPDAVNKRLDLLHKLMVKYGNSEESMLAFLKEAEEELRQITFSDERAAFLTEELQKAKESLVTAGSQLTHSRIKASRRFTGEVCSVLEYLNMPGVRFETDIQPGRYTRKGCDEIEFKISANAGEDMKPLHKIASGGELSRIMLAIKSALLDKDPVGTMIFDEIDTGISGYAADKVGTQLKRVSRDRQVICITHLAQIAARADNHLLIEKRVESGRAKTGVKKLEGDDRINEIARIMSGTEITKNLYNSAKELLDRSMKNADL